MDSNYSPYNWQTSFSRIDSILATPQGNYLEKDSLPDRDALTYTNGFYANCSALFVDIRGSSELPKKYNRPALAKVYRAFISELVAIMNGHPKAREINIVGDCVWGVFNTPLTTDIDVVFSAAAQANSMVKTLGYKMKNAGYEHPVRAGIGMAWGRALMVKAGQSGSTISDVVYMGDVVNRAAYLASLGSKGYPGHPLMVDDVFKANLHQDNQDLLSWNCTTRCWSGSVVNAEMEEWYTANCR